MQTSDKVMYKLAPSVVAEPLVNRWSAWAHLLAPIPASLHLQNYQLEILRSYLADPKVHASAARNPKLRSGRFVDVPVARANEVADLLTRTIAEQSAKLELATSLIEFHNYLINEANGQSLEPLYTHLPPSLRGYVELVYDYYNRPIVRCFESLLYESPYYNTACQSLRIFLQKRDNARPFIMNTPRLLDHDQIDWTIPFEDQTIDEFYKLQFSPQPLGQINEILGWNIDEPPLSSFLTQADDVVMLPERWAGSTVRLRYFGHACVLVEWNGISILTDPYIGVIPNEPALERFTFSDLPKRIDYVLITHNHHDHFCLETLLRLRHQIGCLVVPRAAGVFYADLSLRLMAEKLGFPNVIELDSLDSITLPDGEVIGIPFLGEHADLPHSKIAYVLCAGNERFLFAADSDCLDEQLYRHIRKVIGPIETMFLGMECVGAPLSWSCGPFLPFPPSASEEQSRRYKGCDAQRALSIAGAINAKRIFIYAMGLEPWLEYLLGLAYTDDAVQIREAKKLLRMAQQNQFTEAKILYGKDELHLRYVTTRGTRIEYDKPHPKHFSNRLSPITIEERPPVELAQNITHESFNF